MKKTSKLIFILTLIITVLFSGMFYGCAQKQEKANEKVKKEEKIETIGTVFQVVLENKTGKDITGISVKDSSMETYPDNMLAVGDVFAKDQKRKLFYNATSAEAAAEAQQKEGEPILTPQYDIQLTFDDGTVFVLSAFPFSDIAKGSLCFEEGVAFVEYTSVDTKEAVSTKEAELMIKEEVEAKAEAKAQSESTRKKQTQSTKSNSGSDNSDGCVNDGLFY